MIESMQVVQKLIERYDYGGALEVLREKAMERTDAGVLINSCRYSKNFDFNREKASQTFVSRRGQA